jgi:ligand-binding sensor domain-containing protein
LIEYNDAYYLLVGVGGVYRFNGSRATNISPHDVLPGDDIADMTIDSRGVIWAAGRFGGIAVYQGGNWRRIVENDLEVNEARWRCVSAAGEDVFFGSADGLVASVRDNVLDTFHLPQQLPSGAVHSFVEVEDGVYCLSGSQVVRIDIGGDGIVRESSPAGVVALAADPGGVVWAVGRWGIYQRAASGFGEFRHDIAAVEPLFTAVDFDGEGRLWTATRTGAVYRYDGELWMRMGDARETACVGIEGLYAGDGRVWVYSRERLAHYDTGEWTSFPSDSLGGPIVDLALSPRGAVVAATPSRLWLYRQDNADWQAVTVDAEDFVAPPSRRIQAVAFDDSGSVYLGTEQGLAVIDALGVRWIGPREGIGGEAVIDVFVEDARYLWLGFRSDGFTRIPLESLWRAIP